MSTPGLRWLVILGCACVMALRAMAVAGPVWAVSANLLWWPYLQQLTDTRVIVLWVTQSGFNAEVRYSTDTGYSQVAVGSARDLPFGYRANRVELTGLQPDTTYYYKIYTDGQDLLPAETLFFQTAPPTGSNTPFAFLVFGDYGKNSAGQVQLRDQMQPESANFILTTGDNAYYSGDYVEFHNNVFLIYQKIFSLAAVYPALGNHDYRTGNGAPYLDIFDLPANAWRSGDAERYYSFDYGNAHVVVLDSNAPLNVDDNAANDDMFDWLRADLAQTGQPWKIVAFHHAAYSTGPHGSDSRVQSKLTPIFEQYGVDIVFNGHDHIYERSASLRGGQVTPSAAGGIVYIVSGAGADAGYTCSGNPDWLAAAICARPGYGLYSRVTVNGDTLTVEGVDAQGAVPDSVTLVKYFNSPVSRVEINGPATGLAGGNTTLLASATPMTTTLPITYIWRAVEQSPVRHVNGLVDSVEFSWALTGVKTITVAATNKWGTTASTRTITINPVNSTIHLPVILK